MPAPLVAAEISRLFLAVISARCLLELSTPTTAMHLPTKTFSPQRSHVILGLLSIFGAASPAFAEPRDQASELSLKQALAVALERNPIVVESGLEWRRFQGAAEGVAGILVENPLVSAEGGVRRDQGWAGNQSSVSGRLEQPLDLFGQAGSRRRAAQDLVVAAKSRVALARTEVAARVRLVYTAAQVAGARIALGEERLANARRSVEALELRVRLGASSDIDLRLAMAETARAEAGLRQAQVDFGRAVIDLRTLLDLPANATARPSDPLSAPPSESPAVNADLLARHVAVQAIEKRRLAIDSELVRLERERLPRMSIGIAAERPSNQERFVGLALSISPALWRRNQGPLAEARVERERADYERSTTLVALERRWVALREEQALLVQELRAVETALQNEEDVRSLVQTGWQAGKFDFLRVLLAERSVADTKQSRLALWADLWNNAIEMRRLLGEEP
jgi:outer membrane protein TolC